MIPSPRTPHPTWILALVILSLAAEAKASPFELYGAGARGGAMTGALGAVGRDVEAVFYNPALLTTTHRSHFGAELQLVAPDLHIDRGTASPGDAQGGRDNVLPEPSLGVTVGASVPFGAALNQKLALGIVAFVPTLNPTRLEAIDPASPHFAIHQPATDKFFLGAALAIEPLEGFSIGVGAQALAALSGSAQATLDAETRRILKREFETTLSATIAPIFGVAWKGRRVSVGVTWRGALALDYNLPIAFILEDGGRLDFLIEGTALYTPDQLNLAIAWHNDDWVIAFDTTWARWSEAPPSAATVLTKVSDAGLDPDAEVVNTLIAMDSIDVGAGFADTLTPKLGVERHIGRHWTLRGGYSFRPTPVPRQVGYTNIIDNHNHQIGFGATTTIEPLMGLRDTPIEIRGFVQATILQTRLMDKDPDRDILGIGGYESGGLIWHVGLAYHRDF